MIRRLLTLAACSLALTAVVLQPAAAQTPANSYTATELVGLTYVEDMNDAGHVVGLDLDGRAVILEDGVPTLLATLGGPGTWANGLNANGQVVGSADTAEGERHAFLWDRAGGMQDLGTLGGSSSNATDINDAGQIVGTAQNALGEERACLWQNGQIFDLGVHGANGSHATSINASGVIVGTAFEASYYSYAFRWTPTVPNGTTGSFVFLGPVSEATAINSAGDIAGHLDWFAALWPAGGAGFVLTDWYFGVALAINDSGVAVGTYSDEYGSYGFVSDSTTGYLDLNPMINGLIPWQVTEARAINGAGVIAANHANGGVYVLTPSPLPVAPQYLYAFDGGSKVNLYWQESLGADTYTVKRATTSGGPYTAIASVTGTVNGTVYTDSAVTNGVTYHYVVTAVNSYGESPQSNQASATPTQLPAAPTNLTAATGGKRKINLKWTRSTSVGVTQIRVYRSTTSGGPYSLLGTVSASTTSVSDWSPTSGVTYFYVVTAVSSAGRESANSNQASARAR